MGLITKRKTIYACAKWSKIVQRMDTYGSIVDNKLCLMSKYFYNA